MPNQAKIERTYRASLPPKYVYTGLKPKLNAKQRAKAYRASLGLGKPRIKTGLNAAQRAELYRTTGKGV